MSKILEKIQAQFGDAIVETHSSHGDDTAVVKAKKLLELLTFLKQDAELDFNVLMDLTAVDYLEWEGLPYRYEVVYHFYSFPKNHRVRVKTRLTEDDAAVPSAVSLWPVANWFEREVWDMFGINFEGHPDLRRILMYKEFEGHPLRKDYLVNKRQPLVGPQN